MIDGDTGFCNGRAELISLACLKERRSWKQVPSNSVCAVPELGRYVKFAAGLDLMGIMVRRRRKAAIAPI